MGLRGRKYKYSDLLSQNALYMLELVGHRHLVTATGNSRAKEKNVDAKSLIMCIINPPQQENGMNIMLGNLTVDQIEERIGVTLPEEIKNSLKDTHQQEAKDIKEGNWHCFDIPFMIVFGSIDDAKKFHDGVKHLSSQMKQVFQIGIQP